MPELLPPFFCWFFFFFPFVSAVILQNENSTIHIDAVIDPLSASGQKLTPLLRILQRQIQPSMRIVLNPVVSSYFLNLVVLSEGFTFDRHLVMVKLVGGFHCINGTKGWQCETLVLHRSI